MPVTKVNLYVFVCLCLSLSVLFMSLLERLAGCLSLNSPERNAGKAAYAWPLLNNTQAVLELKCEHEVYINVVKNILCI